MILALCNCFSGLMIFFNFHNYFTCHILTYFYGYSHRVQFSSVAHHVQLFATPWTAAHQASLSITNSQSSPKLMSIESALHIRWPKYWSFSFNISPSNEHSGLISFRMDWLDFLVVQGTLRHHSSKASIFHLSAFFIVQLSHPYMTTEKTIA